MLTDAWIKRFSALGIVLKAPDERGHFQCYHDDRPVAVCDPHDWAGINEVASDGFSLEVVVAVAEWYAENEGF